MTDKLLESLWTTFLWCRGFIVALIIVGLAELIFGWERTSFLEFTHALIQLWNWINRIFFDWIFQWLNWPPISAVSANIIMLYLLHIPMSIASDWRMMRDYPQTSGPKIAIIINVFWLFKFVPLIAAIFWNSPPDSPSSKFILASTTVVAVLNLWRDGKNSKFVARFNQAILFGFVLIASLELMHYAPIVRNYAQELVSFSKTIVSS